MSITILSRSAFLNVNGDKGETLCLSDGSTTDVWSRKTFTKADGTSITLEKGQNVTTVDLDNGRLCAATIQVIRKNSVDIALAESKWEMRFPAQQFIEPI